MSIRRFLLVSILLSMSLVMTIAGFYAYHVSAHEIDEVFDARLAQHTRLIASYAAAEDIVIPSYDESQNWPGHKYENKISFQVWNKQQALLAESENAGSNPLGPFSDGYHVVAGKHGDEWEVFVRYDAQTERWYMAAESRSIRNELVRGISLAAIFPLLAGVLLTFFLIRLILVRGLLPLAKIAEAVESRQANDLSALYFSHIPDEAKVLVNNINGLLDRVRASLERERRFSADAAHEIRTPLAALKLHLENLQSMQLQGDQLLSLSKAQKSCQTIQKLVEQLLVLNRLTPEHFSTTLQPVKLINLCHEVLSQVSDLAQSRQQSLRLDLRDETLTIQGNDAALQIMLRNLLHNAIVYTQVGGDICLAVTVHNGSVILAVKDNGPGIPADERERVFERFYRSGGDSHASGVTGSGLGLAIAREIVLLHGGKMRIEENQSASGSGSSGITVKIQLPA